MRLTYSIPCVDGTQVPTLLHAADYYPYGKVLREFVNGASDRYLTTHHERDQETGLDYRGARYYDSDVARFLSLDPLAADYASWSAYNYVMGNPISLIDPTGKSAWKPIGKGQWVAEAGDGAETLAQDADIPLTQAYEVMQQQGMGTYVDVDGVTKSAVDPGEVIQLPYQEVKADGTDPNKIERFETKLNALKVDKSTATEKLKDHEHTYRLMMHQYGDSDPGDPGAGLKIGQTIMMMREETKINDLKKDTTASGKLIRMYSDSIKTENAK
jgi:RHS repeat-associated protein